VVSVRKWNDRNLVYIFIALAGGCLILGSGITFGLLAFCAYYQIDITLHWWLLGIPLGATLIINVLLIELYGKLTQKRR
jgi:hypothetical protein